MIFDVLFDLFSPKKKEVEYDPHPKMRSSGEAIITHIIAYQKWPDKEKWIPIGDQIIFSHTPVTEEIVQSMPIYKEICANFPNDTAKLVKEEYYCTITAKKEIPIPYEYSPKEDQEKVLKFEKK